MSDPENPLLNEDGLPGQPDSETSPPPNFNSTKDLGALAAGLAGMETKKSAFEVEDHQKHDLKMHKAHNHDPAHGHKHCYNFVILPNSPFRRIWDGGIALWVVYLIWKVPFDIAFSVALFKDPVMKGFDTFLEVYFWTDIVLNFRTGFMHGKHLVIDSKEIVDHYVKSWFFIDIFASLPFEVIAEDMSKNSRKSVKMLKLFKLSKLLRIGRILKLLRTAFKYRHIITFVLSFTVFTHLAACLWFLAEEDLTDIRTSTIMPKNLVGAGSMYLESLDQTIQHMFGAATFFDPAVSQNFLMNYVENYTISAGNKYYKYEALEAELWSAVPMHLMSILVTLVGMFYLCGLVGATVLLMTSIDSSREKFQSRMESLQSNMDKMELGHELQVRIKEYYDYLWVEHKSEDNSSHFFYDPDLSENLKEEIAESLSLKTMPLRRVDILSDLSPMAFTKVLMAVVSPLIYMPGDVVFHSTEHAEELFFVSKGDLRLYPKEIQEDWESDAALEKCTEIGENAFIGESKMVLESKWETTLVSVDFSELASLARADLFLILAEFPQYRDRLDRKISQETAKVGINKIKTALREKGRDLTEEELRALKSPPAKNTLDGQIDAMASSGKAGPEQIVALIKQQNQMFKALTTAVNQHGMTLRKIQANVNAASHGM